MNVGLSIQSAAYAAGIAFKPDRAIHLRGSISMKDSSSIIGKRLIMKKSQLASFSAALTAFALNACSVSDESAKGPGVDQRAASIINGEFESGFPAIGALVDYERDSGRLLSEFCSATLIRSNWLLTAAHCLAHLPDPQEFVFLTGEIAIEGEPDAQSTYSVPDGSSTHTVKRYINHPAYRRSLVGVPDIALVELDEPISDIAPIPIFTGDLQDYIGTTTKSVGYGVTYASSVEYESRKRSADLRLEGVFDSTYYTTGVNTGVCYGDSGGPNLVSVEGEWQVAGIHASMYSWGDYENIDGSDTCLAPTGHTHVESLRSWIYQQLGEGGDCRQDADLCHCDAACQSDGLCEPNRCSGSHTCSDLFEMDPTNAREVLDYYIITENMTPESAALYNLYTACYLEHEREGDRWIYSCLTPYLDCVADGYKATAGTLSCSEAMDCINNCNPRDRYCPTECLDQTKSDEEVWVYRAYYCAYYRSCALDMEDDSFQNECPTEWEACKGFSETDGGINPDPDGSIDADVTDGGMEDAEPDAEEDASGEDATSDAGDDAGSADASDDASSTTEDSGASTDSGSSDAAKPSANDANIEEDDDDDSDDGCSAIPGSRSGSWLAFLGLPLLFGRRRRSVQG